MEPWLWTGLQAPAASVEPASAQKAGGRENTGERETEKDCLPSIITVQKCTAS